MLFNSILKLYREPVEANPQMIMIFWVWNAIIHKGTTKEPQCSFLCPIKNVQLGDGIRMAEKNDWSSTSLLKTTKFTTKG